MTISKSIFSYLEKLNYQFQDLSFRFPIETLDSLLKNFYKDYDESAFLLQASKSIPNLTLKKISKSYLLKVPVQNGSNEHLYIGMSDLLTFLVLFDEPNPEEQNISKQRSRFFLTFDTAVINLVFNYFYRHYCKSLTIKEKKLLIRLKNVRTNALDPMYVSKFQEALLINALSDNNKIKQAKILEAISFTDESVLITDLAGTVKETNKNFEKYFGKRSDINSIKDILPHDIVESAICETAKKSKWQSEVELVLDGKKSELLLVSCYLFKDELGRPNGFVFTFKNITELKKLDNLNKQLINKLRERNVQLTEVNKRLLEADRIKTDLLSVVSHELKTPVSTILGFSELIANRQHNENTITQYAEQINASAKNLDRLITDYLDVACNQFGASSDKLYTMPLNLIELIRVCFKEEQLNFSDKRFQLELNCLGYEPVVITEAQNMQKLFGNLINNSLKYSPNGGKVSVKILNDGENVTVSISDQGIGLTIEQAKQVFEPFYRADNSITRESSGIGLGLAVCKKIVELYKGSIWCEPGVDLGTVFYITLPVNPNKVKAEQKINVESKEISKVEADIRDKR
ncbi:MAG: PAS domain-containing sensor histidine kinase [Candidatus Melainabacteria bacterium]|nr:PAS domain-containing sensor histidine kinase [Candidatus Melainabacteria bacterium]